MGGGDDDYDGDRGYPRSAKAHFYLVVNGRGAEQLQSTDIHDWFSFGASTSSDFIFVFIDIAFDLRLKKDLQTHKGGKELYRTIKERCPVFLYSVTSIPNLKSLASLEILPANDYQRDVGIIYSKIGRARNATRLNAIKFLKKANGYISLKPSIFGVGANLNQIIGDLLDRLERPAK
jgi:hypothetical protein